MNSLPPGLVPDKIQPDRQDVLQRRVEQLLAAVGECEPPEELPTPDELASLWRWIQQKQKITDFYVAAMVSTEPKYPVVERLASHILAAALDELEKDLPPSPARLACTRVRQLQNGLRPELRRALENDGADDESPDWENTEEVFAWLVEKRDSWGADGESLPDFDGLNRLLRRYVNQKYTTRDSEIRRTRHTHSITFDEESDLGAGELHLHYDRNTDGDVESATVYSDADPSGSTAAQRSSDVQRYRARAAASQISRHYMMSPISWGVFSKATLSGLVELLSHGAVAGNVADALLFLSLLTGRHVDELVGMNLVRVDRAPTRFVKEYFVRRRRHWALRSGLLLPPPQVDAQHLSRYRNSQTTVDIPLPAETLPVLERGKEAEEWRNSVKKRIEELREELPQVTKARIAHAGHQWLYHDGKERTVLDRLFATDPGHAVPIFYENMREESVLEAFDAWVKHVKEFIPENLLDFTRSPRTARIGSRRTPRLEALSKSLPEFRKEVQWHLAKGNIPGAHDRYAVYTYLLLSLATGLRPVESPFATFDHFCDETKMYYVRDKDTGGIPSPRFVPVAQFAVTQLNHYRDYLPTLEGYLYAMSGSQRDYIRGVWKNVNPFLFTLDGPRTKPTPLSPRRISKILNDFLPFDLNWTRHVLRTELSHRGVRDDVIQAFMGHGKAGQEPFSRYSALTVADLAEVSRVVDEIAAAMGAEPLAHRGGPGG